MPTQRRSLQQQGVPIPDHLNGRKRSQPATTKRRHVVQRRTPIEGEMGGTQTETITTETGSNGINARHNRSIRQYSPIQYAEKSSAGVGLLEAEFFGIIFLLIIQLFVGSDSYGDKMMSFMKRGTLTAILFFFLALIAGIGSNAAKITKGLGALVFVGILISTSGQDVIESLDNFFKADWTGSTESANDSTADTGTSNTSTSAIQKAENAASSAVSTITDINIPGIGPIFAAGTVINALKKLLHL